MNKTINNTNSSLNVKFSRGTGLGSTGNESIELQVNNLVYETAAPKISGPAGIVLPVTFDGFFVGSDLGLIAIVKNALATY